MDLRLSNELLIKLSKKYLGLSPVEISDQPIFTRLLSKDRHISYGDTWTYVTQGAYGLGENKLGYKYYDGENIVLLGFYPRVEDPAVQMLYFVRPVGKKILRVVSDIADLVKREFKINTYIKKINSDQFAFFKKLGWESTLKYPWHSLAHSEDDTYPEQVIEISNTFDKLLKMSRRSNMKHNFIKSRKIVRENDIVFVDDNFEDIAWKVVSKFFDEEAKKYSKVILSHKYDYYNMIYQNPVREGLVRKLVVVNKIPLGFFVYEKTNDNLYTNLYALIILRSKLKYLSDYVFQEIMKTCDTRYLNTGGSEDEGIHFYKKKYLPVTENVMRWATNFHMN